MSSPTHSTVPGSFRDPAGFLFRRHGTLYRQINQGGQASYEALNTTGLYEHLLSRGWIIRHREVDEAPAVAEGAWKVIAPEPVGFVSWPFEWCFSQLRDAALLTLDAQLAAIEHGMILKDASAYNVQFERGRPLLIDTLSFAPYAEGQIWPGYRQFCQHFLAPLALMARRDVRLSRLLALHIDGIPLDLASDLLGRASWLRPGLLMHLHLHARAQKNYADAGKKAGARKPRRLSRNGLVGIVSGLRRLVAGLEWKPAGTEWADYYSATNYSDDAFDAKRRHIEEFLDRIGPSSVWDVGANTGLFSRIAADRGIPTVAFDIDPAAVELNYRQVRKQDETYILPLVIDLTNPSPAIGWANRERPSLGERGPADCVMALALIHHLAISNNVPLERIAAFLAELCRHLIIEFVPKADSQVRRLLASREDIFEQYHQEGFERAFGEHFELLERRPVDGSERVLYRARVR